MNSRGNTKSVSTVETKRPPMIATAIPLSAEVRETSIATGSRENTVISIVMIMGRIRSEVP